MCRGLGQEYLIGDTYNKLYPTCRHAQPAIEGVLDLAEAHGFGWEDVAEVWVGTHQVAYDHDRKDFTSRKTPRRRSSAFPTARPWPSTSTGAGICHLTEEYRKNPEILGLAAPCEGGGEISEVQAVYPKKRGAKVAVTLKSGQRFEEELYDLKGIAQETGRLEGAGGKVQGKSYRRLLERGHRAAGGYDRPPWPPLAAWTR